jgi:fructoselysine-6-P-deglycase FrlB-like protein
LPEQSTVPDRSLEPMLFDVYRQPAVWRDLARRAPEIEDFARHALTPDAGGRLFVFGSGDGWFAARAAAGNAADPGWTATSGLPFLIDAVPGLTPRDRVLAISMSGNVDRTVDAARAAADRGVPLAILTNADGGRLGQLTDRAFRIGLDDVAPFLCGTTSYTATLAVLMGARSILADQGNAAGALDQLADTLATALPAFDEFARTVAGSRELRPSGARFLAVGRDLATADYGAAKLVELSLIKPWSDDIEEFAHRQYWTTARDELAVFLPGSPAVAKYASNSAEALGELGLTTLALEPHGCAVPGAAHRLPLPGPADQAPLMQAVALQLLAYRLAPLSGTDPNRRLHLKDDALRFSVSRKLTRRSLLGTGQ